MTGRPRALVTGGAGFIGGHFVRYLCRNGWEVRAVDVHEPPAIARSTDVEFRIQDMRDRRAMSAAIDGMDYVFNLASVHLDVHASYERFVAVNVKALEQLVELSAASGVRRFVQVSSVGVYGHVQAPPAREDAPLNPDNDYERTKAAGEVVARACADRTGLDLVVIRPSWVYGAGCLRTAKLIRSLRQGRFFFIGKADNLRHPVYIEDLLVALDLAARTSSDVAGRTYNIAGPRWMTLERMVADFAQALGVRTPSFHAPRWLGLTAGWAAECVTGLVGAEPPLSRRTLAFFEHDNAFDIGAARRAFGYEPKTDLDSGVQRAVTGS